MVHEWVQVAKTILQSAVPEILRYVGRNYQAIHLKLTLSQPQLPQIVLEIAQILFNTIYKDLFSNEQLMNSW